MFAQRACRCALSRTSIASSAAAWLIDRALHVVVLVVVRREPERSADTDQHDPGCHQHDRPHGKRAACGADARRSRRIRRCSALWRGRAEQLAQHLRYAVERLAHDFLP